MPLSFQGIFQSDWFLETLVLTSVVVMNIVLYFQLLNKEVKHRLIFIAFTVRSVTFNVAEVKDSSNVSH